MAYVALVPAAGLGTRMGSAVPKQYLDIHGRPMLWHALRPLLAHPRIERVYVALSPQDEWFDRLGLDAPDGKLTALRCGGETRAASVRRALDAMRPWTPDDDVVLVHDAARPCLTVALIDLLIEQAGAEPGGGLLAVPVADTLKRADSAGHVIETEPRAGLWQAQTPQMFRYGLLRVALDAADSSSVTDEASAVERLGFRPKLVAGQTRNLKVTYPEDLELASLILERREKSPQRRRDRRGGTE